MPVGKGYHARVNGRLEEFSPVRRWLQLRFDFDSSALQPFCLTVHMFLAAALRPRSTWLRLAG